jgi:hypothetical protein
MIASDHHDAHASLLHCIPEISGQDVSSQKLEFTSGNELWYTHLRKMLIPASIKIIGQSK